MLLTILSKTFAMYVSFHYKLTSVFPCSYNSFLTEVTASPQTIHPIQTGSHVMVDTGVTAGNVPMGIAGGGSVSLPLKAPSPSLAVPGTVPSVSIAAPPSSGAIGLGSQGVPSGSAVHFNILQGPGGENLGGPQMAAGHALLLHSNNCVGPACSAKNGFHKSKYIWEAWRESFDLLPLDLNYILGGWNYRIMMVHV